MGQPDSFIVKLTAEDRHAACAVLLGDVATLHHEARNYAVEDVPLVVEDTSFLTCAEAAEVLGCLRDLVLEELEDHSASLRFLTLARTNLDVHEYLRILYVEIGQRCSGTGRAFRFLDEGSLLLVVKATREQLLGHLLLSISNLGLNGLDCFELVSDALISGTDLGGFSQICNGLIVVLQL